MRLCAFRGDVKSCDVLETEKQRRKYARKTKTSQHAVDCVRDIAQMSLVNRCRSRGNERREPTQNTRRRFSQNLCSLGTRRGRLAVGDARYH